MAQLSQSKERKKRREGRRKTSSKTVPDGRAALLSLTLHSSLPGLLHSHHWSLAVLRASDFMVPKVICISAWKALLAEVPKALSLT